MPRCIVNSWCFAGIDSGVFDLRILYFHQHFSTPSGAAGIRSYAMAKRLVQVGHSVTVVCGSYDVGSTGLTGRYRWGKRVGCVDGIRVIEYNMGYSNKTGFLRRALLFVMFALRSICVVLTEKSDLTFATSTPLTAGIPGIAAKILKRNRFVFEVRDLWPELPVSMGVITNSFVILALSLLEKISYRCADQVIGLSPGICRGISRIIPKSRVDFIPNGCDIDIFAQRKSPKKIPGVKNGDFVFIYSGTCGIANDIGRLLDAAEELMCLGEKGVKIVIIGGGRDKLRLVERAERSSLSNVVFLDPVGKEDLSGYYASSNCGLQLLANNPAFYYGTSPNKFFDYIAAGLPVLCNYPGWVSDLLDRYDCGVAVLPDSRLDLARAMIEMSHDLSLSQARGHRAQNLAFTVFDRDLLANKFKEALELCR